MNGSEAGLCEPPAANFGTTSMPCGVLLVHVRTQARSRPSTGLTLSPNGASTASTGVCAGRKADDGLSSRCRIKFATMRSAVAWLATSVLTRRPRHAPLRFLDALCSPAA